MNVIKFFAAIFLTALVTMQIASAAEPTTTDSSAADTAPAPTAGGFFADMGGAITTFTSQANKDLAEKLASGGYKIASYSTSTALTIGGALALIYLLYEVMQFLSGQTKSMLVVLFDVGIPCAFAALLIKEYAAIMPKFEQVLNVFRFIVGKESNPVGGILSMYGSVLENCTTGIANCFKAFANTPIAILHPIKYVANWIDLFATIVFILVILVLVLSGVAEVLGLLLLGPFLFAVGVAFGPIMIAGLVTPWTRDYFSKWIQFVVISAGLTGVINVIFTIASTMMDSMELGQHTTGEPTAVSMVIICVLLLTVNSMISQAPGIASALFPGHVGASKTAGGDIKKGAKDAAGVPKAIKEQISKNLKGVEAKSAASAAAKAAVKAPTAPTP
jgi:hypothetical protein